MQLGRQTPAVHDVVPLAGAMHALPQAPQCAREPVVSASQPFDATRSQSPRPLLQVNPQAPPAQNRVALSRSGQVVVQPPQWSGSKGVDAHEPPQLTCPEGHTARQAPPAQASPVAQARLQAPQWSGSLARAASQPSAARPLQSPKPVEHALTPHSPPAHEAVALGSVQTRPQAPQCEALVRSGVSRPSAAVPLQSPKPDEQDIGRHAPTVQAAVAVLASAQWVPQAPQFAGSLDVLEQYALAPVPQVASDDSQFASHAPARQVVPARQRRPHIPQFASSV